MSDEEKTGPSNNNIGEVVTSDEQDNVSASLDPSVASFPSESLTESSAASTKQKKAAAALSASASASSALAASSAILLSSFATAQSTLASSPELAVLFPSLIIALSAAMQQIIPESKRAANHTDFHQKIMSSLITQTQSLTLKQLAECPPYVHLSPKDCASQLYLDPNTRLAVYGSYSFGTAPGSQAASIMNMIQGKTNNNTFGGGGYRTVRANAGVSSGTFYFETLILHHPLLSNNTTVTQDKKVREFVQSTIPSHIRLGDKLKQEIVQGLIAEEMERLNPKNVDTNVETMDSTKGGKKRKTTNTTESSPSFQGGHVRIGWSMRSGDLQAPVGYDQYSYAYRDIMGSKIHNSKREDYWFGRNGEASFGPGDVVGFAICLEGGPDASKTSNKTNHIRFFKNGEPMGILINSKGTRTGGEAFDHIMHGTYYPAISAYMGGSCRVNFGPYFIYPIKSGALPTGMKLLPMGNAPSATPAPPHFDKAMEKLLKEKGIFGKKVDDVFITAFKEAAKIEASLRYECYQAHLQKHLEEVRLARVERNLNVADVPASVEDLAGFINTKA